MYTFNNNLDAIRELIYMQVLGADKYGPRIMAQMLRTQLCSNGKYVLEDTRFFRTHLIELVKKAINTGEIDSSWDATGVAEMILRQSRGLLFDWSMRGAPYSACHKAVEDLNIILSTLQKPK